MPNKLKATIETIFEDFYPMATKRGELVDRQAITIWLPTDYKQKFDDLQTQSQKQFGKRLRSVVMSTIDRFDGEDEAS